MKIPLYQVDAFTTRLFQGNPAAVCPLERWLPDSILQAIAAENNLSETAYYVPTTRGYDLRRFTPTVEVDLAGHPTLAAAHVIWAIRRESSALRLTFTSKSGELAVDREDGRYILDFPSRPPQACKADQNLLAGLGVQPTLVLGARDYLCVFEQEEQVRALSPDMARLAEIGRFAVIVTAPRGRTAISSPAFSLPRKGFQKIP